MAVEFLKVTREAKRPWRNDFKIPKKILTFYVEFNTWTNVHFRMTLEQR